MPTPPKKCLRLHELEDRSLMSADAVVTGTDAHDVITLNRVGRYRVEVAVQSFRDAEWTQPTGDPVERYELQLTPDQLDAVWEGDIVPAMAVLALTTNSIRVEAGAGTDRIEIIDRFTPFHFVSGTHGTDDRPADEHGLPFAGWLRDDAGGKWVSDPEVALCVILPFYERTLTEGVDMESGRDVAVRFDALTGWWPEDPIWFEPLPPGTEMIDTMLLVDAVAEVPLDAAGLDLLIGEVGEVGDDWAATEADGWLDGGQGPDGWSEEAILDDLWVEWAEWADDAPIDESDWWTGSGEDGSDGFVGEETDDWMATELESAG